MIIILVTTAIILATTILQYCFRQHIGTGTLHGTGHCSRLGELIIYPGFISLFFLRELFPSLISRETGTKNSV